MRALWILGWVVGCDVYDPALGQAPVADAADEGSTSTGFLTGLLGAAGAAAGATGAGSGGLGGAAGSAMAEGGSAGLATAAGGVGGGAGNSGGGGGSGGRSAGGSGGAGSSGGGSSGGRMVDAGPPPCPTGILLSGENNTALHGGADPSDVHFKDVCPMGGPVIGYTGSIDSTMPTSVGKIATVCGKIAIDASNGCKVLVNAVTTMPMRGTVGDVPFTQTCPPNQVVIAFQGRAGIYLDQVSFTCAPLVISSTPMGYQLAIGTRTGLPPSGGNGGGAFQDGCAAGQVVEGTNVTTSSGIVDAAGLICGAFSLVGP